MMDEDKQQDIILPAHCIKMFPHYSKIKTVWEQK